MEKILIISSVVMMVLIIQQMWIYYHVNKVKFSDTRQIIIVISFIATLNIFVHYGFTHADFKARTFFVIEIFRFTLFFSIVYYYCKRASGLLPNKRIITAFLKILFIICIVLILAMGIILIKKDPPGDTLCVEGVF